LATAAIFVVGGIKLGEYVVRKYFDPSLKEGDDMPKTMFLDILAYVMAYAYVAEFIGLSAIVGAFIAGITLNYSRLTSRLFELFYPLEALFVPVFFITLGMLVNIPALWHNLLPILAITALAMASKFIACGGAALATGMPAKDATIVGVGMSPRGEIALIIGLYGLTAGVLGETEYSIIASVAFLTTIGAPWLLKKAMNR
ncbi:MAG: cation:proton antiporter, partial [Candidatus Micrarchaeota archaeon]